MRSRLGRRPQDNHGCDEQPSGPGDRESLLWTDFPGFAPDELSDEPAPKSGTSGLNEALRGRKGRIQDIHSFILIG